MMTDKWYVFFEGDIEGGSIMYQALLPDLESAIKVAQRLDFTDYILIYVSAASGELVEVAEIKRVYPPLNEYADYKKFFKSGEFETAVTVHNPPKAVGDLPCWRREGED